LSSNMPHGVPTLASIERPRVDDARGLGGAD
jgi:hypothetical protein